MSGPLLEIDDLVVGFGGVPAVDGVSLRIERHQTFALVGESGCGKSVTALSTLRLLSSNGRIQGGSIRLEGVDLLRLPEREMRGVRGGKLAMIFQEPMTSLNPVLDVADQIGESLRLHKGLRGRARQQRVLELLEAVGIPDPEQRARAFPHQLSGGMKQRVMIAIALAGDPELLIADEPTTALDVTIQAQVLDLLKAIQLRTGMAILLITHDLGVVAQVADRVAVMYAGQVVEEGPRAAFFRQPLHPYTHKLFAALPTLDKRTQTLEIIPGGVPALNRVFTGCRFADRCEWVEDACRKAEPAWVSLREGQGARCRRVGQWRADGVENNPAATEAPSVETAPDLLQVQDLKVHFPIHEGVFRRVAGHIKAVDGISLELAPGRTLALVGESGCGKTTLGKGLLQLIPPSGGQVHFQGQELTGQSRAALRPLRRYLQMVFQDPYSAMNPRMTVAEIIGEGLRAQGLARDRASRERRAVELLQQVGLPPGVLRRYPHEFSGGQRQRICIARALAVEPRLIVCDEPTSALDVSVQAQILNLLKDLQQELRLAYLFITHNLSVVAYLAHDVAVMYLGRVVERGPVEEILQRPRHPYTQALLSAVPHIDPKDRHQVLRLEGDPPSPANPPSGCHFHPRCPHAEARCARSWPPEVRLSEQHRVHCFLVDAAGDASP